MRSLLVGLFASVIVVTGAFAALHFPTLTGRVVDDAHVLSPSTQTALEQKLADYENGTSNQVVVITLPSLEGYAIEDYGYQLGRAWQIGQKGKNNGALLIVVPSEHKVRIEVGYGLEPILTDAASNEIIQGIILPAFRAGHVEKGIVLGTDAILAALGGQEVRIPVNHAQGQQVSGIQAIFIILLVFFFFLFSIRHPFIALYLMSGSSARFGSSGIGNSGWGSEGFSGGGGSFGGGGASGSW